MRRSSSSILLICAVLTVWGCSHSLTAADDELPGPPAVEKSEKPTRKSLTSEKAVVKDIVYGLEESESRLHLTSQPLDGADRQIQRTELEFDLPENAQIVELSLARLDGKNLMAVVKVRHGKEYDFHCLTFIAASGGHVREEHAFHKALFFTTQENLKILAVGGQHFEGSVFIVLGDVKNDVDREGGLVTVTSGAFYFSVCPWPPSDGVLTPFRTESVLPLPKE